MKRVFFLILASLLILGCAQPATAPAANSTPNATLSAPKIQAQSPVPVQLLREADLCIVERPGILELILFDRDRYAYEGRINNQLNAEMIFRDGNLYFRAIPPVGGCEWALFNPTDLQTVSKLGDVLILNVSQMKSRLLLSQCQRVPL
ncbi:MAG TPA: hypothetical protein VI874_05190, partial [Candidatus Norongarragalinales archaeon]|nr:hypothetical protein [Candidatus Norongarragalinales archaeon]